MYVYVLVVQHQASFSLLSFMVVFTASSAIDSHFLIPAATLTSDVHAFPLVYHALVHPHAWWLKEPQLRTCAFGQPF